MLSMPADLLILRSVQIINSNVRDFLEKRETSFISEYAPNDTVTGQPKYYANWDETNILLAPTPDSTYTIQINFIKDPPHFDSSTNHFPVSTPGGFIIIRSSKRSVQLS